MTFQGNGPLDTSGVSGGGGGGGGGRLAIGGGAGLVITVVALLFGINPGDILGGDSGQGAVNNSSSQEIDQHIRSCTIEKANQDTICRITATTRSLEQVWTKLMPEYTQPRTKIFANAVSTNGCGSASSATGPFYCPADETAYFDPTFFDTLASQLGGSNGPLAQEYVVAHEFGHHIENITGVLAKGQRMGNAGSVRIELQADCLAGVWVNHASEGPDAMLKKPTQQQIQEVIQTAKAIGDDAIQGSSSNPEGWTHGSSEQRVQWFTRGYQTGEPARCDTFARS